MKVIRLIAVQDRAKHNSPLYPYGVCKMFFECSITGGEFKENSETTAVDFFTENSFPDLAIEKNNEEQLKMCFKAHRDEHWMPLVE